MRRNPNGYGNITKLKGNRSRPYIIRMTVYDEFGRGKQKPIGYAETEEQARIMLAEYNSSPWSIERDKITMAELYRRWKDEKAPKLGKSNQSILYAAYKYCSKYYGMKYRKLKAYHMQDCVDSCEKSTSTKAGIKNLFCHLDAFAFEMDIIDKMYSQLVTVPPAPETKRRPFSQEDIDKLWSIIDIPWADSVLIYIYTGFRLTELIDLDISSVDLDQNIMTGGKKTRAGKNRIIPIHHRIQPLVKKLVEAHSNYLLESDGKKIKTSQYYEYWYSVMDKLGVEKHVPHEARHTFETMLDNAGANRKCIDMLMGHSSKDVGNRVYNHKTIQQLRDTIELLV